MTLIARVSRLFRADLHAVLDQVEEPDLVLRQAVRDMEEDLARDQRRLEGLRARIEQTAARDAEIERSLNGIEEELDVCFEAGKDNLSRTLIRRRLEGRSHRALLSRTRSDLQEQLVRLEKRVREHGEQLEAMRGKAELLVSQESDAPEGEGWDMPQLAVRDADVEIAFLRERQRRERS